MCQKTVLLPILSAVRKIMFLIQIIVPIILILWGMYSFIELMHNPEKQNGIKKVINRFIAAAIVFFIPLLVNVVMGIAGDSTNFTKCWKDAKDYKISNGGYSGTDDKKKVIQDSKKYE